MISILQLSDLHRSFGDPISNAELLSALISDIEDLVRQEQDIPRPTFVVVTGDLVQGLPLGSSEYPSGLQVQYNESLDFLREIADHLLQGDRSRVIIVPGNHDVDWTASFAAMQPFTFSGNPHDLLRKLASPYRWSWKDRQLFQIVDPARYAERFRYYENLISDFYQGTTLEREIVPARHWNLYWYPEESFLFGAFNSCVRNDCFRDVGEITTEAISEAHLASRRAAHRPRLSIAVWHHSIQGPPEESDYIDLDTVQVLIDRGFRMGLHGHHHKADVSPVFAFGAEDESMAIISAGSLCAGARELPTGYGRQYNLIVINDDCSMASVHVREMVGKGIYVVGTTKRGRGANPAIARWSKPVNVAAGGIGFSQSPTLNRVERIESLLHDNKPAEAEVLISKATELPAKYRRDLLFRALVGQQAWPRLLTGLGDAATAEEVGVMVEAGIMLGEWDKATEVVRRAAVTNVVDEKTKQVFLEAIALKRRAANA